MSRTVQITNLPGTLQGAEDLVQFLENVTGTGSVYACKMIRKGRKSRLCANVQFVSSEMAANICKHGYLRFELVVVRVNPVKNDIIVKAFSALVKLSGAKVHTGCQISHNKFCLLWSSNDRAVAEFGLDAKRVSLYVNEGGAEYKMKLSFADIQYIHLRHLTGKSGPKLLFFELRCVPRIYYREESSCSASTDEDVLQDYYTDGNDSEWTRTTDFTPFCSIGQSSEICLELPPNVDISLLEQKLPRYKEIQDNISFQQGLSNSDSKLVPIINPSQKFQLPYKILFQINSLIQRGILRWPNLTNEFFSFLNPDMTPIAFVDYALAWLKNMKSPCFNPVKPLQKKFKTFKISRSYPNSAQNVYLGKGLMHVHRVHVTPSKVYFFGPEANVSNRVTRQYANYIDDFLRVTFVDENGDRLYASDLSQERMMDNDGQGKTTKLYSRILSVLKEGILIGDKKFEFLAFSTSQLREGSVWMFASNAEVSACSIRKWMGHFSSIKNVAKCAARMGQAFSSSTQTLHVHDHEISHIPDICWSKYTFSDGIGKISLSLAEKVAAKCTCDTIPSAFQIRYGGYKGVVAVDPKSPHKLSLRPSMMKYRSDDTNLDVLSWSKFRPCFLNRQIISLLSTLGVKDRNFEKLQEKAVEDLDRVLTDQAKALDILQIMSAGEHHNALISMLSCGYFPNSEPYLLMMLNAFRASKLLELRSKTRLFVPNGRCLMGCLDESRTLNYGEVFVQVSRAPGNKQYHDPGLSAFGKSGHNHKTSIVKGKVIVAKNPCFHPGDIRTLVAVDTPKLHHMVDCVVFPQRGSRYSSYEIHFDRSHALDETVKNFHALDATNK
ncbi:hypothetical protein KI387_015567, partial [Taxus chinensis]